MILFGLRFYKKHQIADNCEMKFIELELTVIKKIFLQLRSNILLKIYNENVVGQIIFKRTVDYYFFLKKI